MKPGASCDARWAVWRIRIAKKAFEAYGGRTRSERHPLPLLSKPSLQITIIFQIIYLLIQRENWYKMPITQYQKYGFSLSTTVLFFPYRSWSWIWKRHHVNRMNTLNLDWSDIGWSVFVQQMKNAGSYHPSFLEIHRCMLPEFLGQLTSNAVPESPVSPMNSASHAAL